MKKILRFFGIVTVEEMNKQLEEVTTEMAKAQVELVRAEVEKLKKGE